MSVRKTKRWLIVQKEGVLVPQPRDATPGEVATAAYNAMAQGATGLIARREREDESCEELISPMHSNKKPAHHECTITPRQLEVLKLVAEGLSSKQVGKKLLIEHLTVKTHLRRIRYAFGQEKSPYVGREWLVAEGFRTGYLS